MGAYRTLLTHLSARYDAGEKREQSWPAAYPPSESWPAAYPPSLAAPAPAAAAAAASVASSSAAAPASASGSDTGAGGVSSQPRKRCHVSTALLPAIEALAASGDTSTAVAFDLMARSLRRTPTPNP